MFEWGFLDADGSETGQSESFDSQADAELWFAMNWEPLAAGGTTDVVLRDKSDGAEVYKMSLAAE
ncbi:MAG: hypothetical protein QOG88_1474 [Actinomycetota bacterium]|jgi:hypothetical protein|nr:hypothetical protein [Actinomycetota bacterium]